MKLDNIINPIVDTLLPKHIDGSESYGNSLMVSVMMSYNELITDDDMTLSNGRIAAYKEKYPFLNITTDEISCQLNFNWLFIQQPDKTYYCFSNIGVLSPFTDFKECVWKFETNHGSCWRVDTHKTINQKINDVARAIYNIFSVIPNSDIKIPKHVIPNFIKISGIKKSEIDLNYKLGTNVEYMVLENIDGSQQLFKCKYITLKDVNQIKFDKVYDLAISDYKELTLGKRIYGLHIEDAYISSPVFKDKDDVVWVQISDKNNSQRKFMLSLATYGINFTGTHNLVFDNVYANILYNQLSLSNESSYDEIDGKITDWITPTSGKRTSLTKTEFDALPLLSWSCIANDFTGDYYKVKLKK